LVHLQGKRQVTVTDPGTETAKGLKFRALGLVFAAYVIPGTVKVAIETGFIFYLVFMGQCLAGNRIDIVANPLLEMVGRKDTKPV
jgi:hypothetical protein